MTSFLLAVSLTVNTLNFVNLLQFPSKLYTLLMFTERTSLIGGNANNLVELKTWDYYYFKHFF